MPDVQDIGMVRVEWFFFAGGVPCSSMEREPVLDMSWRPGAATFCRPSLLHNFRRKTQLPSCLHANARELLAAECRWKTFFFAVSGRSHGAQQYEETAEISLLVKNVVQRPH